MENLTGSRSDVQWSDLLAKITGGVIIIDGNFDAYGPPARAAMQSNTLAQCTKSDREGAHQRRDPSDRTRNT